MFRRVCSLMLTLVLLLGLFVVPVSATDVGGSSSKWNVADPVGVNYGNFKESSAGGIMSGTNQATTAGDTSFPVMVRIHKGGCEKQPPFLL